MSKKRLVVFSLSLSIPLFFSGCAEFIVQALAPSLGSAIRESKVTDSPEAVYAMWQKEHNRSKEQELSVKLCVVYDTFGNMELEVEGDHPGSVLADKLWSYDRNLNQLERSFFESRVAVEMLPRADFILDQWCDLYVYTRIEGVGIVYYKDTNRTIFEDKSYAILEPSYRLYLFDKKKREVTNRIYTANNIKIDDLLYRGRPEIKRKLGWWYLDVLADFYDNNMIMMVRN